jgi:dehydrogenase/reductase SDR family protein 7B
MAWILALVLVFLVVLFVVWLKPSKQEAIDFSDQVVWVVGASSGLGEALCYEAYKAGATLVISARREGELERVSNACETLLDSSSSHSKHPPLPKVLPLDLNDLQSLVEKAEEALHLYGKIDVIILNAGLSVRATALETSLAVDQQLMNVNYLGGITLCKAVLPAMIKNGGGHVIVVSSVQGKLGIPNRSAYAASKHALHGFWDSARFELQKQNVRVTVACPGYVRTNLSMNALTGTGQAYGQMDETTAKGLDPRHVAHRILVAAQKNEREVIIAKWDIALAVRLKSLVPGLITWLIQWKAK